MEKASSHFKGAVEISWNRFIPQIQRAKQRDEAAYYCGARLILEQNCIRVEQILIQFMTGYDPLLGSSEAVWCTAG